MRKVWGAGAAVMMLAAFGLGPTLAQGDIVTGTGNLATGHMDLSDPRVSGDMNMDVDTDLGQVFWGTWTIEGPDGDWVGPFTAIDNSDLATHVGLITLEGTEAYEGWAFVFTWIDQKDMTGAVSGRIYEGSAPRMEWLAPAASPSPAGG